MRVRCLTQQPNPPWHYLCSMDHQIFVWLTCPSAVLLHPPTPLPPFSSRSFPTGRSRSGIQRSQTPMPGFSTFVSGVLVSGWTWWLTTDYRRWTTSWSTATPTTATSSGVPWWRRPTPSSYQSQQICRSGFREETPKNSVLDLDLNFWLDKIKHYSWPEDPVSCSENAVNIMSFSIQSIGDLIKIHMNIRDATNYYLNLSLLIWSIK